MTTPEILSAASAFLNLTSAILVLMAVREIRRKRADRHRKLMITALCVSSAFLVCYLVRTGLFGHSTYAGTGWTRPVYFVVLLTHTPLAIAIVPLILRTLFLALKGRLEQHRRLARLTYPLWMYVSVTGVIVYLMLRGATGPG